MEKELGKNFGETVYFVKKSCSGGRGAKGGGRSKRGSGRNPILHFFFVNSLFSFFLHPPSLSEEEGILGDLACLQDFRRWVEGKREGGERAD